MNEATPALEIVFAKHGAQLVELSADINRTSTFTNGLIDDIEGRLKHLNLGVEASVLRGPESPWRYGYGKVPGHKWCLYIQYQNDSRSPLAHCHRNDKIECLMLIPDDILDALVVNSEKLLKELNDANDKIAQFLAAMQQ